MFKILSTYICLKKYIKCNIWRVAVRPSYIWDARFLKVKYGKVEKETKIGNRKSRNCINLAQLIKKKIQTFVCETRNERHNDAEKLNSFADMSPIIHSKF
jgi:hypothetical protein